MTARKIVGNQRKPPRTARHHVMRAKVRLTAQPVHRPAGQRQPANLIAPRTVGDKGDMLITDPLTPRVISQTKVQNFAQFAAIQVHHPDLCATR